MNAHGKVVDTTYLSVDQAEDRGFIHRDYIAHCLRWSHVCKRLAERKRYQSAIVLDVGCGRELPMAKMLYSSRLIPRHYFGVDAGPIEDTAAAAIGAGKFPFTLYERTNLLELDQGNVTHMVEHGKDDSRVVQHELNRPNIVTCFEVLEHVEPKMMLDMLAHLLTITSDNCTYYFSTPCWNRTDCAANHVNEMTYEALGAVFERSGFHVENVYGTFASIRDYQSHMRHPIYGDLVPLFEALREYYDTNFLSCIFAPIFPGQSRNCLWELKKQIHAHHVDVKFAKLEDTQRPWGSSAKWEEMLR